MACNNNTSNQQQKNSAVITKASQKTKEDRCLGIGPLLVCYLEYSSGLERVTQAFDNALTCDVVLFHVVRAHDVVNIGIAVLANGIVD